MKLSFQCDCCDAELTVGGVDEDECMEHAQAQGWLVGVVHRQRDYCAKHAREQAELLEFDRLPACIG